MEKIKKKFLDEYIPILYNGPKENNYIQNCFYYCSYGVIIFGFLSPVIKMPFKNALIFGIALPLGYLHQDLYERIRIFKGKKVIKAEDIIEGKKDNKNNE